MSAQAPICHIPPETPAVDQHPIPLPAIPPAEPNLHSLAATVNAMRQTLLFITGRQGPRGAQGQQGRAGSSGNKSQPARWTEQGRTVEVVRVFNPDDKTQFVDVERINQLRMKDGITGESWTWDRDRK